MDTALYLALIIVSIAVIAAVLVQSKGGGMGGGIFGGEGMYTSRRGVEKTLFNATIGLLIVFILLDLAVVLFT